MSISKSRLIYLTESRIRSRRGMGLVVILVVVLLGGLAVIGLANYKFVEQTTLDVGTSVSGDKALFLAQSAVEEAIHIASLQVNDPSQWLFENIRSQSITEAFDWQIEVPQLMQLLIPGSSKNRLQFALTDNNVKAKVMFQNSFETMLYEKYGTIEFSAEVSTKVGFGRKLFRKYRELIGFRMQLISAPRPYDQATIYVHKIDGWIKPVLFNGLVQDSENELNNKIPDIRKKWHDQIDSVKNLASKAGINLQEFHDALDNPPLKSVPPGFTAFPNPMVALSVTKIIPKLEDLNLAPPLNQLNEELRRKKEEVQEKENELERQIDNAKGITDKGEANRAKDEILEATKELGKVTGEFSELNAQRILLFVDFQKLVRSFGEPYRTNIDKFYIKFETAEQWSNKASYLLDESGGLQQNFDKLLKKMKVLNGVMYVRNDNESLKLKNMRIRGKLLIVTQGDVEVEGLTPEDETKDIVSVISFGKMRASGSIKASLMPQGEFQVTNPLDLQGNLIFDKISDPGQLKGKLQYDERIFSGTTTATSDANAKKVYYYVGFSPMPIGHDIQRQRAGL